MNRRYEVRKREMMEDCRVTPGAIAGLVDRLHTFAQSYLGLLGRRELREHALTMWEGMLSDLPRKTTEPIAYRADEDRGALQRFMGWSPWDPTPLREELARHIGADLGEPDGVIVFDPSGHAKQGKHSVGVARQWCGRLGKVENCQVGVYMGYASRQGHALVDTRLFLPREWTRDRKRCRAAGIPPSVKYRTRHELALDMLAEPGAALPHAWIAGDAEMGRSSRFRGHLRALGERYVLAVPSNTTIRDLDGRRPAYGGHGRYPERRFERVAGWTAARPESAWTCVDVRDGEKGPLIVECLKRRVCARTEGRKVGPQEWLVVTRTREADGSWTHAYYLTNAPEDTPLVELARVIKAEHRIEECLERAKGEAGLSQYELRTWIGWYHHQTLSMIAAWFLAQENRRGKKGDAGDDVAPGGLRAGLDAA
jgi:SRSO17 transposase